MEKGKDLSALYILIGAVLAFVVTTAVVMTCVTPRMRAREGHLGGKPSIPETQAEARVTICSACIAAALGMFAGHKVYSMRQRRAARVENESAGTPS